MLTQGPLARSRALLLVVAGVVTSLATAAPCQDDPETPPPSEFTYPERIFFAKPDYPADMRELRRAGRCSLLHIVDTTGRVGSIEVLSVSRDGSSFLEAAIAAVCQWRYKPAEYRGLPVPRELMATFNFQIGDSEEDPESSLPLGFNKLRNCEAASTSEATPGAFEADPANAIDVSTGGPAPLGIGYVIDSLTQLEAKLPGFELIPLQGDQVLCLWRRFGMEATLDFQVEDQTFRVRSISYTFLEKFGSPTPLRTVEGLGRDSACVDVLRAFGTTGACKGADQDCLSTYDLDYPFGGTRARFSCIDHMLARLTLSSPLPSPQATE